MDNISALIRRRPITAFLLWFFTVGQALAFAPLYLDVGVPDQWFIIASTLVGLLLPTVVITRMVDGTEGLRALGDRIMRVRGQALVYIVGLAVMPLLAVGMAVALLGLPAVPGSTVVEALGTALIWGAVFGFVFNNLWEEVAWMGFVQARLQQRRGPLLAATLTAPLFALQHTALAVGNGLVGAVVLIVALALISIPFRAFTGWVYNRTGGSLFLVGLVHALSNAVGPGTGLGAGYLRRLYPANADVVGILHIVALGVLGLIVIASTRGRLGLPGRRGRRTELEPSLVTGSVG